jgi:hypothetical protein
LGAIAYYRKEVGKSLLFFMNSLSMNGENASAIKNVGVIFHQQGLDVVAAYIFDMAIELAPSLPELYLWRFNAVKGRIAPSLLLDDTDKVLKIAPKDSRLLALRSELLVKLGNFDEAIEQAQQVLCLAPGNEMAANALLRAMRAVGRYDDAYQLMSELKPALANSAQYKMLCAEVFLARGEWRAGWEAFLSRFEYMLDKEYMLDPYTKSLTQKPSKGCLKSTKTSNVLVHHDQGIGEELMFLRYFHYLAHQPQVVYVASDKLYPLLKLCAPDISVIKPSEVDDFDSLLAICDVPFALDIDSAQEQPLNLTISESMSQYANQLLAGLPRPLIGVAWQGGSLADKSSFRRVEPALLASALPETRGCYVILQHNASEEDVRAFSEASDTMVVDISFVNRDLIALAAVLESLDHYVGVINTSHHLLNCLQKTSVALVSNPVDSCAMEKGEYSPWLPFTRLIRGCGLDWSSALESMNCYLVGACKYE